MKKFLIIAVAVWLLVFFALPAHPASMADFNWKSSWITAATVTTCTVTTSTSRKIHQIHIVNTGSVDVFYDMDDTDFTVDTGDTNGCLEPNDTMTYTDLYDRMKTIKFKTASGTGEMNVHAILFDWSP